MLRGGTFVYHILVLIRRKEKRQKIPSTQERRKRQYGQVNTPHLPTNFLKALKLIYGIKRNNFIYEGKIIDKMRKLHVGSVYMYL